MHPVWCFSFIGSVKATERRGFLSTMVQHNVVPQSKRKEVNITNSQPTIWSALAEALTGSMTYATSGEEIIRRSIPDADGLLPSDHIMEAIKEALSRVPGVVLCETEA